MVDFLRRLQWYGALRIIGEAPQRFFLKQHAAEIATEHLQRAGHGAVHVVRVVEREDPYAVMLQPGAWVVTVYLNRGVVLGVRHSL